MAKSVKSMWQHVRDIIVAKKSFAEVPLEEFDEVDYSDMHKGFSVKSFLKCEGSYLLDMFDELRNSTNNNYVTCVDTLIYDKNFSREMFKNFNVSVIVKRPTVKGRPVAKNELIASRVANILGVQTEYIAPIQHNKSRCLVVDFLKNGENMESFTNFVNNKNISAYKFEAGDCCIRNWIEPLIRSCFNRFPYKHKLRKYFELEPIIRDFVKLYLFKKYIIHDSDLCGVNVGVITSKDGKQIRIAPAFDFEQAFNPGIRCGQAHGLEEDLHYLAMNYPTILNKVIKDFELTKDKSKQIKDVLGQFEESIQTKTELYNLIENSTITVVGYAKIYLEKNPQMVRNRPFTQILREEECLK